MLRHTISTLGNKVNPFFPIIVLSLFVSIQTSIAESKNKSKEQADIQRILNLEYATDVEILSKLKKYGILGEKIATYLNYSLDMKKTPDLDNFFNYHVAEFFYGRDTNYHFGKIIGMNKDYNILPESDYFLNTILYKRTMIDGFEFSSDLQVGSHIKNLRYLARYSDAKWDEYENWILPSKGYLYNREVSYWENRIGQQICDRSDRRKDCISKIKNKLKNGSADEADESVVRASCKVSMTYKGEFYEFDLCSHPPS
jgi:hypothetical protein